MCKIDKVVQSNEDVHSKLDNINSSNKNANTQLHAVETAFLFAGVLIDLFDSKVKPITPV